MALELHLPDLPELSLGPVAEPVPRAPLPWHRRVREALSTYLPVLLMTALALLTWWLVKSTPQPEAAREAAPPGSDPDYTMTGFVVERFDAQGRLKARVEGDKMRHYPDVDRFEVDGARVRTVGPDGRQTLAQARRALSNGDGSEVQLFGDARVESAGPLGDTLQVSGEFLHVFVNAERLRSHLPVVVRHAGSEIRAAGIDYDHLSGLLQLQGPMRAWLPPQGLAAARRSAQGSARP